MRVSFRAVSAADEGILLPMMRSLYEHERLPFEEATIRSALGALLADSAAGGAWLVLSDGAPAGYLLGTWGFSTELGGRFLFLDELLVVPERRGQGLGSAALAFAEEEARRGGAGAVRLEVDRQNPRALELYLSAGYTDPGRRFLTKRLAPPAGGRRLRAEGVEVKALVKTAPERVWEAIATAPGLDAWFTSGASVDAAPGGRIAFRWERWGPDDFTGTYEGAVVEADPPRRFAFRWPVDSRTYETTVEIELEPRGGVTLVRLAEHGFEEGPAGLREMLNRAAGWGEALALMKMFVEYGVRA